MSKHRDNVPCYIAVCPACQGIVMICVADPANPSLMQHALRERRKCEKAGLSVETVTVADGKARLQAQFGHVEGCAKDPRRKKRQLRFEGVSV